MATDKVILKDQKTAGSDLSEKQFFFVKITTANTLELAASGDIGYVLDSTPKKDEPGTYVLAGIAKVKCAGTIKAGKFVVPNKEGLAVEAAGSSQNVAGVALEEGKSGQLIAIFVQTGTGATA